MKFKPGDYVVTVRNAYQCHSCSGHHDRYFYGFNLTDVPLQTEGKITEVSGEEIEVYLGNGGRRLFHQSEIDILDKIPLGLLKRELPGIDKLPRQPVFEIAQGNPVFLANGKVYSLGEGTPGEGDNFYEQKNLIRSKRTPLIEIGDFESLESLLFDRAKPQIEKLAEEYVRKTRNESPTLKRLDSELDIPQLIYKLVFPYLRDNKYKDKVSELLLGVKGQTGQTKQADKPEVKAKITPDLERIADELLMEVEGLIAKIKQEGQEPAERSTIQQKLKDLLSYKEPQPPAEPSLLAGVLNGRNIAILDRRFYALMQKKAQSKEKVHLNGQIFSVGKELQQEPTLEDKFLLELGKKIRIDALREHLSREKITDMLLAKNQELLAIAGRTEYKGEGFGFLQNKGNYYAYIDVPAFATKGLDGNYYLFDKTRVGEMVFKSHGEIQFDTLVVMDNNNHPLLDHATYPQGQRPNFAKICVGGNMIPATGKDLGEVIAKRLRKFRDILRFGFIRTSGIPLEAHQLLGTCRLCNVNHYKDHIRSREELEKMGVPIY